MAAKKHYHVLVGLYGYLPNSNYYCSSIKQAEDTMQSEAEAFRDAGYKVTGNKRMGYDVKHESGYSWQYIEYNECQEEECNEDDW